MEKLLLTVITDCADLTAALRHIPTREREAPQQIVLFPAEGIAADIDTYSFAVESDGLGFVAESLDETTRSFFEKRVEEAFEHLRANAPDGVIVARCEDVAGAPMSAERYAASRAAQGWQVRLVTGPGYRTFGASAALGDSLAQFGVRHIEVPAAVATAA